VEEVLKQIFEKLTSIESGLQEQGKRLTGLESGMQEQSKRLTGLESGMQEQGKKLTAIEKTQNYHSEMFGALINAQETQKAQIDKLEIELAKLSERTDQGFTDIVEVQKSLLEMYGDHEAKIRMLRRMPV
jgi:chromosome segregation ATPase